MSVVTERDAIVDELRRAEKLLLTTHENPDGDALGSLLGMHLILRQLGKDSVMFMAPKEFPLPYEYQRMPLDEVAREIPGDLDDRVVVFLDCGNIDRMPIDFLHERHLLNIDHHHDNTHFGDVNLVVGHASCTAEILWDLARDLGVEMTPEIATALYIALVTDTGKFMFENTTPRAHEMAAEMIEAGVQPQEAHRSLYEGLPFARLQLLARALNAVQRFDGGQLTLTHITREDFAHSNATESDSEGIVNHLRQVESTVVAALVRELIDVDGRRKVSLRATDKRVDVSIIARGLGGGGHRQAAGFTTDVPMDQLIERLRREIGEQLPLNGVLLLDKPAGVTSHDVVAGVRRRLGRGVKVGHAGTLDPFATGLLLVLVGRATRVQRFLMDLPKTYRAVARLGWTSDTGDRDGTLVQTGRVPSDPAIPVGPLMQRPPAYSAVKVGGERLYKKARRGEHVEVEPRQVTVHRAQLLYDDADRAEFEIECSSGTYVRALIAELGDAYCEELRRTRIGEFDVRDADEERLVSLEEALAFLPGVELSAEEARVAAHGVAVPGSVTGDALRLVHDGRLVAIARSEGNQLRPYLVFA